jgi:hypothetical protein
MALYQDPDEATLEAARRIKWHRRRKFILHATAVAAGIILVIGVALGIWITNAIRGGSSVNAVREPDQSYATLACGAIIRGVTVPPNGYQLPHYCRTVISVNFGSVRVFQGEGLRTFDMGANMRSNPYNIDRVYPADGWANIDIITLRPGQATYSDEDFKQQHPPGLFSRYQ